MNCIIVWMNNNQGFIMGILTLVYVGATILIWVSNKKAANAATAQIKEMKRIQHQNVDIQLFDKRYEVYSLFEKWCKNTYITFSNEAVDPYTGEPLSSIHALELYVYGYPDIKGIEARVVKMEGDAKAYNGVLPDSGLNDAKKLKEDVFAHHTQIQSTVIEESSKILKMEFFYPSIDMANVRNFTHAFVAMTRARSIENLKALEDAYKKLNAEQILGIMKNQLDLTKISEL